MGLLKQPKGLPVATQHVTSLLNSPPLRYNFKKYPLLQIEPLHHCTCTMSSSTYMYFPTTIPFIFSVPSIKPHIHVLAVSSNSLAAILKASHVVTYSVCCHIVIKLRLSYSRFTNLDFTVTFPYQLPGTPCFTNTWHR